MAANPWTLDDYNAGKIEVDKALGWSPQDAVDYYNRYHPRDSQTDTAQPSPSPSPGASTTNQYTGAVDPSLQTVKPASGSSAPLPYSPSIPLGPTTGGSTPTSQSLQGTTTPDGVYHFNMGDAANPTTATPTGPVSTTAPPGSQGAMDAQVRQRLLELLGTDTNNVSTQDADVAPQSRAFNAQVDREAAAQRAQM